VAHSWFEQHKEVIFFMASSHTSTPEPTPPCPVCHKTDQVRKAQAAYEAGVEQLIPPTMPGGTVSMMRFMVIAMALVALGAFFILVLSGNGGFESFPGLVQILQVVITLAFIVTALVHSLIAFLRVVQGDLEAQKYYPAWDQAMENWRRLYYCARDKVVFDPKTNKVLSDAELKTLLSTTTLSAEQVEQHTTSARHQ
jgi:hypothetical protein